MADLATLESMDHLRWRQICKTDNFQEQLTSLNDHYRKEYDRILTYGEVFKSSHTSASALDRAGFIFKGPGHDEVICLWCQVVFANFKAPVDADALHMAYSENVCQFLINPEIHNEPLMQQYGDVPSLQVHPVIVNG